MGVRNSVQHRCFNQSPPRAPETHSSQVFVCGLAAGLPFIMPNECGSSFSGRVLRAALDLGVLNASFSVTSPHSIHPDAVLSNLFGFAESHGASISDSLRSMCYQCEQMPTESVSD